MEPLYEVVLTPKNRLASISVLDEVLPYEEALILAAKTAQEEPDYYVSVERYS